MHRNVSPKIDNGRDYTRPTRCRQSALWFITVLIASLFLSACTNIEAASAPPTVKIGLVAPFEGLHRPLGYEALFAVKLALQERNRRGGLDGYRVELVALNDFDEPAEAKVQAQALLADPDVLGVVGHLSSATTQAALPVYQKANLAVSVPWTTAGTAQAALENGVVHVAVGEAEISARLEDVIRTGGYEKVARIVNSSLAQITDDIQAVDLDTDSVTAGEIMLALAQAEISLPVFGQVDVGSPQVVQVAKTTANGLTFVSPGPAPADVDADAFIEAYQALAGFPPGPRAVLTYDATNVLLDAIEQAMQQSDSVPPRAEIGVVIKNIQRRGLSGDIAFDAQGHRKNAPVWVYQIFNEEYPGKLIVP